MRRNLNFLQLIYLNEGTEGMVANFAVDTEIGKAVSCEDFTRMLQGNIARLSG